MAVVPDDDDHGQRISDEDELRPSRSQTPPTPPGEPDAAHSPPPSPRPMRQRAMTQLRPVSIPNIVCDVAGPDPLQKIAAFEALTGTTCLMDSLRRKPRRVEILMHIAPS
jgi:hypothetical protein